jgi:uncharacterized protein with von Willebrand factor type A (vWA) domain
MGHLLPNVLVFGRLLREAGLEVHVGRLLDVAEALQHVSLGVRADVYHTCRALLVHRREDLAVFDRVFDLFWIGRPFAAPALTDAHAGEAAARGEGAEAGHIAADAAPEAATGSRTLLTWSDVGVLAAKDFAEFTAEEMALGTAALNLLQWTPGERRTRRWVRGDGPKLDLRRALAQSVRTGGDVVHLPRQRRRRRPRPLVLLCDVSGSMDRYSRMLLHFAHALGRRHRRVEAFLFSTQLTRITTALHGRALDAAVADVSRAVPDWAGGTRIGEALRQFHQQWARRVLHGGPVVLLISDGWDRGDPRVLREQVKRLQRSCHRLVWLNPLIGTADYAPLTRGLQAALPYVDDFLAARTLTNLADLAVHLNSLT